MIADSLPDEVAEKVEEPRLHADLKAAGHLVHEDQARSGDEVSRNLQPLLHLPEKARRSVVDAVLRDLLLWPASPVLTTGSVPNGAPRRRSSARRRCRRR